MNMEREMILQTKGGNRGAFSQLIRSNAGRAYRTAYRLLGNVEDAADLCQEAFLRAYQNIFRFDENKPFYPWLYRILKNLCLNHLKRRKKQPSALDDADSWDNIFSTTLPGPDEQLLRNKEVKQLWRRSFLSPSAR